VFTPKAFLAALPFSSGSSAAATPRRLPSNAHFAVGGLSSHSVQSILTSNYYVELSGPHCSC